MEKLVLGTRNPGKLAHISKVLLPLGIHLIGLEGYGEIPDVEEIDLDPRGNAKRKALAYVAVVSSPVLSIDNALSLDGLEPDEQPGVNVRRINGADKRPTDEELIDHYSRVIEELGGKTTGKIVMAACLALVNGATREFSLSTPRIFVSKPCSERIPGYPLDSLQIDPSDPDGKLYIAQMRPERQSEFLQKTTDRPILDFVRKAVEDGFLS
jgi:XTP/dITP diphosphohydrolase